jgi:hypothetical protein
MGVSVWFGRADGRGESELHIRREQESLCGIHRQAADTVKAEFQQALNRCISRAGFIKLFHDKGRAEYSQAWASED